MDREQLIRDIAAEARCRCKWLRRDSAEDWTADVVAALERLGYTITRPERVVVEQGREFDNPHPNDTIIEWPERFYGAATCPPTGTINGHPWHRVTREVIYTPWTNDPEGQS